MFHYLQSLSHDDLFLDDFCHSHKFSAGSIYGISDYDLGGEGDLFKAPEPIIEPQPVTIDDMTAVISTILCEEDIVLQKSKLTDVESREETLSPSEILNFKLAVTEDDSIFVKERLRPPVMITKSVSSDCLSSVDGPRIRPNSVDSADREPKSGHGMRRVFSEGYIKPQLINDHTTETRMQKLSRYRDKKTKRNFGRKIKYACRKALADGQPRIKGRFAKTEEANTLRM